MSSKLRPLSKVCLAITIRTLVRLDMQQRIRRAGDQCQLTNGTGSGAHQKIATKLGPINDGHICLIMLLLISSSNRYERHIWMSSFLVLYQLVARLETPSTAFDITAERLLGGVSMSDVRLKEGLGAKRVITIRLGAGEWSIRFVALEV